MPMIKVQISHREEVMLGELARRCRLTPEQLLVRFVSDATNSEHRNGDNEQHFAAIYLTSAYPIGENGIHEARAAADEQREKLIEEVQEIPKLILEAKTNVKRMRLQELQRMIERRIAELKRKDAR